MTHAQSIKKIFLLCIMLSNFSIINTAPGWFDFDNSNPIVTATENIKEAVKMATDKGLKGELTHNLGPGAAIDVNVKTPSVLPQVTFFVDFSSMIPALKVGTICCTGLFLSIAAIALIKRELKKDIVPRPIPDEPRFHKVLRVVTSNYVLGTLGFLGGVAIILGSNRIVQLIS